MLPDLILSSAYAANARDKIGSEFGAYEWGGDLFEHRSCCSKQAVFNIVSRMFVEIELIRFIRPCCGTVGVVGNSNSIENSMNVRLSYVA